MADHLETFLDRARYRSGIAQRPHCGAVIFIQRFGDALNLNVHFHTLVLDGVFVSEAVPKDSSSAMRFLPLPPPDDHEVRRVAVRIALPARDRRRLERLCRYVARPPLCGERLSKLGDGRLLYRLKRRWSDGTLAMVFEPHELIEKVSS